MYGYKVGDRVRVVGVMDDPDPVELGTLGTIRRIVPGVQMDVEWDNGRSLMLALPEDLHVVAWVRP